jgi:hypothetical protein
MILTDEEYAQLGSVADRFAASIRANAAARREFQINPVGYLMSDRPVVVVGQIVESIGRPRLQTFARDNGFTLWSNVMVHLFDREGNQITRGFFRELDGLLLGGGAVGRVVTFKMNRNQAAGAADQTAARNAFNVYFNRSLRPEHIRESNRAEKALAITGQRVGADILERFSEVRITFNGGRSMEVGEFQDAYRRPGFTRFLAVAPYERAETADPTLPTVYLTPGERQSFTRQNLFEAVAQEIMQRLRR